LAGEGLQVVNLKTLLSCGLDLRNGLPLHAAALFLFLLDFCLRIGSEGARGFLFCWKQNAFSEFIGP